MSVSLACLFVLLWKRSRAILRTTPIQLYVLLSNHRIYTKYFSKYRSIQNPNTESVEQIHHCMVERFTKQRKKCHNGLIPPSARNPLRKRLLKESSMKMSTQEVGHVPVIMERTARLLALRSSCKFSVRINHFSVYLIFSHKKVLRG